MDSDQGVPPAVQAAQVREPGAVQCQVCPLMSWHSAFQEFSQIMLQEYPYYQQGRTKMGANSLAAALGIEMCTRCTCKSYNGARSRNHLCLGKAKSIIYFCVCVRACVCVGGVPRRVGVCIWTHSFSLSYPACNAHAPYYILICGLSGSTIFIGYLINGTIFGIKCVF
jgi:hypothetical protein